MSEYADRLKARGACDETIAFAARFDSPQAAWDACEDGVQMEWLLDKLGAWPEGAYAEFDRVRACAYAEFERRMASAIRRLVPTVPELGA